MSLVSALRPFAEPVSAATAVFPAIAALSVLPFALIHYRKYGRVHPWRAFVAYSFAYYALAAIFLVLLPLPDLAEIGGRSEWESLYGRLRVPRLDPLGFLRDITGTSDPTWKARAILQASFNFLLLFPFGAYISYLFKKKPLAALGTGFLASLAFEICQLTGVFWIYPGPYRLFDVGDLILNSAGAFAGAVVARALERRGVLPGLSSLEGPTYPWIGPFRRAIALAIDGAAFAVSAAAALALVQLWAPRGPEQAAAERFAFAVPLCFWFVILPALDGGQGLGKRITLCAITLEGGLKARRLRILARQTLIWALPAAALTFAGDLPRAPVASTAAILAIGAYLAMWASNAVGAVFSKEHAGWLDRRLGTRIMNRWGSAPAGADSSATRKSGKALKNASARKRAGPKKRSNLRPRRRER
ncbi:MAG: VanZ family protein [Spirochaetaceae bacterium]|nr:VanZ family protein [Spirochaetaceae bacterium]